MTETNLDSVDIQTRLILKEKTEVNEVIFADIGNTSYFTFTVDGHDVLVVNSSKEGNLNY